MASTLQKGASMANGITMLRCGIVAMGLWAFGCGGSVESSATDAGGDAASDTGSSTDGGNACGGKAGIACPEGFFCKFADGTCHNPDEAGTCQQKVVLPCPRPRPGDEVCACDGNTYQSACEATSAFQSILRTGACHGTPTPVETCGGSSGDACSAGKYCEFGDGMCPAPGSSGVCTAKPSGCSLDYTPVCGCDGATYGNACAAHVAGITIAYKGECATPTGKVCGGLGGAVCDATEYCDWGALPNYCGGDDGTGICKKRPTSCIPSDGIYCGCDGKVYESPCAAALAGQGVRKNGPC